MTGDTQSNLLEAGDKVKNTLTLLAMNSDTTFFAWGDAAISNEKPSWALLYPRIASDCA
jgi:hypothetical protein